MTTEEIRLIVGANVRRRRVELGLSQRALGDAVELSGAQINRIEKGVTSTPVDLLARLSVPLDWEPLFFLTPQAKDAATQISANVA